MREGTKGQEVQAGGERRTHTASQQGTLGNNARLDDLELQGDLLALHHVQRASDDHHPTTSNYSDWLLLEGLAEDIHRNNTNRRWGGIWTICKLFGSNRGYRQSERRSGRGQKHTGGGF